MEVESFNFPLHQREYTLENEIMSSKDKAVATFSATEPPVLSGVSAILQRHPAPKTGGLPMTREG